MNNQYDITDEILDQVSQIMEKLGQIYSYGQLEAYPRLKQINKIKSICANLSLENIDASPEMVNNILNSTGEYNNKDYVLNLEEAFDYIDKLNPYDINDIIKIHGIIMKNISQNAGFLRKKPLKLQDDNGFNRNCPPPNLIPELMNQLMDIIKNSPQILVRACVFQYVFEFIQPFDEGNHIVARFWQKVILSSWKPIFKYISIEDVLSDNIKAFNKMLSQSLNNRDTNSFIEYMLGIINKSIDNLIKDSRNHLTHSNQQVKALLNVIESYPQSSTELMAKLNLKSRNGFRLNYIIPALEMNLIEMTLPDKPTSKNQMYYKK